MAKYNLNFSHPARLTEHSLANINVTLKTYFHIYNMTDINLASRKSHNIQLDTSLSILD